MNKKIEQYIIKNYFELLSIAKKISRGHELHNDLLNDVLLQLYEKTKEIELKSYDDNSIKYYIVAVMRINWNSTTSPFYYKNRKESDKYSPISDNYEVPDDFSERMDKEILIKCLEISFAELGWFEKSVMELYLTHGSLKGVARKTGIPVSSISRYVNRAKDEIKQNTEKKYRENDGFEEDNI
jgi:RNA polymerase sigma factor (sigma-70 family)